MTFILRTYLTHFIQSYQIFQPSPLFIYVYAHAVFSFLTVHIFKYTMGTFICWANRWLKSIVVSIGIYWLS